ncbi:MAG: polyphosphate kinase 1 [Fusobacteriaceae bacterium]
MEVNNYKAENFYNRELSWLEFNRRVLEEAEAEENPLLERAKFLAIVSSNFDEFFKVRVAGLKAQEDSSLNIKDISGMTAEDQLIKIRKRVEEIVDIQYLTYDFFLKEIESKTKIEIKNYDELDNCEKQVVEEYYREVVFPVLTPMAVDVFRPLPNLNGGALHLIINVKKKKGISFAIVEIPRVINRIFQISEKKFILLEEIVKKNIKELFNGYEIIDWGYFRITRDEDLTITEGSGAEDLLSEIEKEIKNRKWGNPVRIEHNKDINPIFLEFLRENLEVNKDIFYSVNGPLDLNFLWKISALDLDKKFKFINKEPKFYGELKGENFFKVLSKKNIILQHPYESFEHVIDLVQTAAADPCVLAIKQTLYRVSGDSPIIKALMMAAEKGKQVTVLVELKARFDEERNLRWARELEDAGCHVIYGLSGLKTHAKCLLIIRKEEDGIKRYVHMGTGNYNDSTAKLYVDTSFFTRDEEIGSDASYLFNKLTGFSEVDNWKKIIIAPIYLRNQFYKLIDREIENKKNGLKAKITAKVNGLTDQGIIEKFYDASKKGVEVVLLVRGACCLKSGIKNVSENIKVYSLVGRFLEHDRIYCFENGGDPEYYLASADLMGRNLDGRIEIMFPVEDKIGKKKIATFLEDFLSDNCKLRIQNKNGSYSKVKKKNGSKLSNYQDNYINEKFV